MAINNTIDEQAAKLGIVTNVTNRIKEKNNGHTR
jgi:hypothetical protein